MSLAACADLVRRADPERFLAAMAAPPVARQVLFPIYAFNVEVSRAPWVTDEPMIAEMRLQWWRDALAEIGQGAGLRSHEVTLPLAEVLNVDAARILDRAAEARRWDIYRDPFDDRDHLARHIDATAGGPMWVAARKLGAPEDTEGTVRDVAWAAGLAGWFRAIPELEARGRWPLPDGRPDAVRALAREGLERLRRARRQRHGLPRTAVPALYASWLAGPVLSQAASDPARVTAGRLGVSEFRKRARLIRVAATGLW